MRSSFALLSGLYYTSCSRNATQHKLELLAQTWAPKDSVSRKQGGGLVKGEGGGGRLLLESGNELLWQKGAALDCTFLCVVVLL